ncbi:MAG: hypothetical protein OEW09_14005 [Anaerolineae bacterium]|nr:hypothetical protein [Anaerolineae bacterium]
MVNKSLEFIRNLWIKARLKVPPSMQRTVILCLHEVKEIVRLLGRPYLPVYQLQGRGQGGPLMVTYIGLEYARPFLKSILFVKDPVEQQIGRIPFWRYDELANLSSGDMIIVEATKHLIRKLPRQNAIVLPHYVHHILDVRGDWQDVRSRFHKSVRKNELRWIRKYGYEYDVSYDRQDFETFYHQMYLPTMDDRHGELSSPMSIHEAYQYFQHGWLFRVTRNGDWVSGVICHLQQDVLMADILGVKDADTQLVQQGATAATYYAAIHWTNQHEYSAVNFLGSVPYLRTGWFQHKRKWGVTVSVPPHLHRQIWIKVRRSTPVVSQFLKDNPCIVVDKDGKLHGLVIVDDPHNVSVETRKEWEKRYATPGLSSLLVRSLSYFSEEPTNDNDSDLVIPLPLGSSPGSGP